MLSVLLDREGRALVLRHASLLMGPARLGEMSWARWRVAHGDRTADVRAARSLPTAFFYDNEHFAAGRVVMEPAEARDWLMRAATTDMPAVGPLPATRGALRRAAAPLRVFPRLGTPVARLAVGAVRSLHGFFCPVDALPGRTFPVLVGGGR